MGGSKTRVDPDELISAAGQLDRLADQIDGTITAQRTALNIRPSGADEVSTTAAATLNAVAGEFAQTSGLGAHELRKIAAVLRSQARGYQHADGGGLA